MSSTITLLLIAAGVIVGTAAPAAAAYIGHFTKLQSEMTESEVIRRVKIAGGLLLVGLTSTALLIILPGWRSYLGWWGAITLVSTIVGMIAASSDFTEAMKKIIKAQTEKISDEAADESQTDTAGVYSIYPAS